jgi:undecaprenyl-diphosphatase
MDWIMRTFTHAGDWQSWTALSIAALAGGGMARGLAYRILPRLLSTLAVCFLIKTVSRRPRPSAAMLDFSSLMKNPDPYSFPSSHTACAWVVCASLGLALGWGWPIWILYASAISYSRIHVGAHYPLDVLIGTLIGVSIAMI